MDQFIKDMALYMSINPQYLKPLPKTGKEYKEAAKLLEPFLGQFKNHSRETVIQGFTILIGHLKGIKKQFDEMLESEEREKAKELKKYLQNIQKIDKVIECFKYGEYSRDLGLKDARRVKKDLGFFPIDKLIIKGSRTEDKIEIEGSNALDIFRALFSAYYDANDDSLRQFNDELYRSHSIFRANLELANCSTDTIGERFKKYNEKETLEGRLQMQRQALALNIHMFFKAHSTKVASNIPSWHKKLIGELFDLTGLAQTKTSHEVGYIEPTYYVNIGNWIERAKKN